MNQASQISQPVMSGYKDRSGGLLVFGILFLLVAGLCALLGLLGLAAGMSTGQAGGAAMSGVAIVYGSVALLFGSLGVGAMRARRWCRPLVLILSAFAMVGSVIGLVCGVLYASDFVSMFESELAKQPQQTMPEGMGYIVLVMMALFILFVGVVLPLVCFLFFRSPHVKATCEVKDPDPRWTDACPVPVLALVLLVAANAFFVVLTPFTSKGFFPFFGDYLIGFPGAIACLLMASALFYAAWRAYYLDVLGWWLMLAVSMLQSVSQLMTMAQADLGELYRMMGYSAEALMRGFNTANTAAFAVAGLLFLIWVKRYFRSANSE